MRPFQSHTKGDDWWAIEGRSDGIEVRVMVDVKAAKLLAKEHFKDACRQAFERALETLTYEKTHPPETPFQIEMRLQRSK